MTLQEALDSGKPFKAMHHQFWFEPNSYPGYLKVAAKRDWHGDEWETIGKIPTWQRELEEKLLKDTRKTYDA